MALLIAATAYEDYEVSGATLREAIESIPGDEAGKCSWAISYEYDSTDGSGHAVGLRLHVEITIRMPRWIDRDGASSAERAEWDRFYQALLDHERGHERRVRDGVVEMHRRLERTLARDLRVAFEQEKARLQRESDAYDHATDHGRRPPPGTIVTFP